MVFNGHTFKEVTHPDIVSISLANMVLCLVQFFQDIDWKDFRRAELHALLDMNSISSSSIVHDINETKTRGTNCGGSGSSDTPYWKVELPSVEVAAKICERSVLIKHIYQLMGEGNDLKELHTNTLQSSALSASTLGSTWSLRFDGFMRNLTHEEKKSCIEAFPLPFQGTVSLKNPEVSIWILLDYSGENRIEKGDYLDFKHAYCGRLIGVGGMREELRKYDLKKRFYLGPTSLDHGLALMMSTISRVKPGSFVLDPFVGTASILVAASHFKAYSFGTDIDIRVLKGNMHAGVRKGPDAAAIPSVEKVEGIASEDNSQKKRKRGMNTKKSCGDIQRSIWENFRSYGLASPEIVRMDNHLFTRHFKRTVVEGMFDAIVTDPPYGIRAGAKKTGRKGDKVLEILDEKRGDYIPVTQAYQVEEVMLDLLHMAAVALKLNGYLSYLIPAPYGTTLQDLPRHPCLAVEEICEQGLSTRHCRCLVVMKKIREYGSEERSSFEQYSSSVLQKQTNEGFETLIDRLREALSTDPLHCEAEGVVIQASNASMKRKLRKEKRIQLKKEGKLGGQEESEEKKPNA